MLNTQEFSLLIKSAPLISLDLIVKNNKDKILLGKRCNNPAKNYWFVPGGRVFKDESLDTAFSRTVKSELGLDVKRVDVAFDGVYEHFYDNNVFNDDFSTHYIVLTHKMKINELPILNKQHSEYRWFEIEELLENEHVHNYTKNYFRGEKI